MAPFQVNSAKKFKVASWSQLEDRTPTYALVSNVDIVVIRYDDKVSVLYGRCLHRGALMSDGTIEGDNIICGVHAWDYRFDTGVSEYDNKEVLHKFNSWVETSEDAVYVDELEIQEWEKKYPQPYQRDSYQGIYADTHGTPEEPQTKYIAGTKIYTIWK